MVLTQLGASTKNYQSSVYIRSWSSLKPLDITLNIKEVKFLLYANDLVLLSPT